MSIRELIKQLKKYSGHLPVKICTVESNAHFMREKLFSIGGFYISDLSPDGFSRKLGEKKIETVIIEGEEIKNENN
jgi:hypothetical protein